MNNGTKLILLCIFYWIIVFVIDDWVIGIMLILFLTLIAMPLILDTLVDIMNRIKEKNYDNSKNIRKMD